MTIQFGTGGAYAATSATESMRGEERELTLRLDCGADLEALAQETLGTIHAVDGEEALYTWTGFGKIHSLTREVTGGGLAVIMILKEE